MDEDPPRSVNAPWTAEQVQNLNDYQACGVFHPFTSSCDDGPGSTLIATPDGWVEREGGPVVQVWAHSFMTDGTWREMLPWPLTKIG